MTTFKIGDIVERVSTDYTNGRTGPIVEIEEATGRLRVLWFEQLERGASVLARTWVKPSCVRLRGNIFGDKVLPSWAVPGALIVWHPHDSKVIDRVYGHIHNVLPNHIELRTGKPYTLSTAFALHDGSPKEQIFTCLLSYTEFNKLCKEVKE